MNYIRKNKPCCQCIKQASAGAILVSNVRIKKSLKSCQQRTEKEKNKNNLAWGFAFAGSWAGMPTSCKWDWFQARKCSCSRIKQTDKLWADRSLFHSGWSLLNCSWGHLMVLATKIFTHLDPSSLSRTEEDCNRFTMIIIRWLLKFTLWKDYPHILHLIRITPMSG